MSEPISFNGALVGAAVLIVGLQWRDVFNHILTLLNLDNQGSLIGKIVIAVILTLTVIYLANRVLN
jgi:hypothetical protein